MLPIPEGKKYHLFLAHSGKDTETAVRIKRLLGTSVSVFLDCESLLPGDVWDVEIPKAQQESLITVILISKNIEKSFYQREEVAGAIELSRESEHRVVPVYLDDSAPAPYGLRCIHSINVKKEDGLGAVAEQLVALVEKIVKGEDVRIIHAERRSRSPARRQKALAVVLIIVAVATIFYLLVAERNMGKFIFGVEALQLTVKQDRFVEPAYWGV